MDPEIKAMGDLAAAQRLAIKTSNEYAANGTPMRSSDASMKSRSVFERAASFQPRDRASWSAGRTSGNGAQDGSASARAPSRSAGAPSSRFPMQRAVPECDRARS